jgi:hypothetical protein
MRKLRDCDPIKESVEEIEKDMDTSLNKVAFNVEINPASLIGAVTGAAVAKHQMSKNLMQQQMEGDINRNIGNGYYKQVENLANNLKIVFTPFSVIFIVKNGPREITVDTINTDDMNNDMHAAYQKRDTGYFKNLMLNKVSSEVQLVEQMFAKRLVDKQLELQNQITNKRASEGTDEEPLSFGEVLSNVCGIKAVMEKNANSKLGTFYMNVFEDMPTIIIEPGLGDDIQKTAGVFKDTLKFFGLNVDKNNIKELQGKMLNPGYLNGHLQIGFMPDRVMFVVDNMVVTQLPLMSMNEEGFAAFNRNDKNYFKDLFKTEMNGRLKEQKEKKTLNDELSKHASVMSGIKDIFTRDDVHPKIYHLELTKTFGDSWIKFDPEVLIKEIEEQYGLTEPIADVPLNKIWCAQLINKSMEPFTNYHVFEKCVRSFNDKPIDFTMRENNVDLGEIVFGLKIMQDLTPADDIYDNFSEAVFDYLADTLVKNNYRIAYPEFILNSDFETEFYRMLNDTMIDLWNTATVEDLKGDRAAAIKKENRYIASTIIKLVGTLRDAAKYNPDEIDKIVNQVNEKVHFEDHIKNIVSINVKDNIAVDVYLQYKDDLLTQQREMYNV